MYGKNGHAVEFRCCRHPRRRDENAADWPTLVTPHERRKDTSARVASVLDMEISPQAQRLTPPTIPAVGLKNTPARAGKTAAGSA